MIDRDLLIAAIRDGVSVIELAREHEVHPSSIYRMAEREGVDIKRGRVPQFETIERQIENMKPMEAVEFLLEMVRTLAPSQSKDRVAAIAAHGFTPLESQIIAALTESGDSITREWLYDRVFAGRNDGKIPMPGTINVYLTHIRRKFRDMGFPVTITPLWGVGWTLHVLPGFVFPWDRDDGSAR